MMLSLWTVIVLVNSLTNAQLPNTGNDVGFPPSFGNTGGLLSGMLDFVDMFDPSHISPPISNGLNFTDPPSPIESSTSADQVATSSPPNPNNVSIKEGNPFIPPTNVATTLPPSSPDPLRFEISTLVGVTQNPIPRDPFFINSSTLRRNHSTGSTGADSSLSVRVNATDKGVQSAGQRSGNDVSVGLRFNGSGDPLIDLFGGLAAQRRDFLLNAPVKATTTKTTTLTTTIRPVIPTTPVSDEEIVQMLNTFSNRRIVLGKPQGQGQIGKQNPGHRGVGQSHGRGVGVGRKLK